MQFGIKLFKKILRCLDLKKHPFFTGGMRFYVSKMYIQQKVATSLTLSKRINHHIQKAADYCPLAKAEQTNAGGQAIGMFKTIVVFDET